MAQENNSSSSAPAPVRTVEIVEWRSNDSMKRTDSVIKEEPLEIRLKGETLSLTMRTPGADIDLVTGFLFSEGIIQQPSDILEIAHCAQGHSAITQNVVNVFLAPSVSVDLTSLLRRHLSASSCGVCGKVSIENLERELRPVSRGPRISARGLLQAAQEMRREQSFFTQTGGVHAAALFNDQLNLVQLGEDVGRHNAVDKVIGRQFSLGGLPLSGCVLLISGRASFEIMQKAWAGGIPIVAAVSAPSSLAVELAQKSGQTLIGFLREDRLNIYSAPGRVI